MDKLIVNAKYQQSNYNAETDDIKLKALLLAAKLWFQSQTANIDVREIDTHLRAALYKVGSKADIKDLDIWGNTFVPTNDLEHVLKEVKYIIQFLYRGGHIEEHLINVLEEIEQAAPYDDSDADRRIDDFARRILVTNLIPAIIVNSVLEEPNDANGPIPIYDYIAARSTKLSGDDVIKLRNPNDISRSANAMLRVVRHAICTYLYNHSDEFKHDGNGKWRKDAKEIIELVQQAPAIGHICLRLIMSKYDQQKTPKRLKKAVDIASGDVYVAGAYFYFDRWSRAIQHAIGLVEESIKLIFPNHDALEKWRHLDNYVQWSSDTNGTCVQVASEDVEAMEIIRPQDDIIPMLGEHGNVDIQSAINTCFSFEKFAFAYMGVGAARGTEVIDMDDEITNIDFVFNTIVYYLICKKGETHGRYTNEPVQHYLPPSISRIVLLIKLMLWPAVKQSSVFSIPNKSTSAVAANEFFMKVFGLKQSIGTKNNRQAIASMTNIICPSTLSRMTINPIVAQKFQHTELTHNMFYSDNIIQKEGSTLVDYHLLLARVVWEAFGEPSTTPSTQSNGGILTEAQYNSAARMLYGAFSQTSHLQLEAIQYLDNTSVEGQCHAFVFMGTGTGKSGIYNISAAAAVLHGHNIQKTLVISPHNGLLAQHCQQSKTYFQSLPTIRVTSHDSTEISEQHDVPPDLNNADLCFISIHGFQKLMKYHLNTFQQWGFQRIIIDEYHNVISEIFRFGSSWDALSNIASLGTKILCMSATANTFIMQCIAKLLGLGNQYKVIGDIGRYRVPNVAILRSMVQYPSLLSTVVSEVSSEFQNPNCSEYTFHIITMSISDAKDIAKMLNNRDILSMSLHSECTKDERQDIMRKWNNNKLKVLVSTIHDGIDSSQCKHVYIVGGSHNNMALLQSIGRIRPRQQSGSNAKVKIYDTDYPGVDDNSEEDDKRFIQSLIGAGLVGNDNRDKASHILTDLFTRKGYKVLVDTDECLRKELLMKIDVDSDVCGMCSSCLEKNNIVRSAISATAAIEEERRKREDVFDCLKRMKDKCVVCDDTSCDGTRCLEGSNSCYTCHKNYRYCRDRNLCTLKRDAIFTSSNGNRHLLCTWCFGPKGLELHDAMRHEKIYHQGDRDDNGRVIRKCTLQERPKRLLLYSQTNDDINTTTYLTPAVVSERAYYNFFHEKKVTIEDEKMNAYVSQKGH